MWKAQPHHVVSLSMKTIGPGVVNCELQKHQTKSEMWLWRLFHTWYMCLETSVKFHQSCLWSLFLMWARMDPCNITLSSPYHHGNPDLWRYLSSVPCLLSAHPLHNGDLVPLFSIWKEILVYLNMRGNLDVILRWKCFSFQKPFKYILQISNYSDSHCF